MILPIRLQKTGMQASSEMIAVINTTLTTPINQQQDNKTTLE